MKLKTFRGGIHPPEKKDLTNKIPVTPHQPTEEIIISLRQHIGTPCEPIVSVGDHVYMGQKIGDSTAFVSAPVHSSVSGEVVDIKNYPHPGGGEALSIFIKNDFKDELDPSITPWNVGYTPEEIKKFVNSLEPKEIVKRTREAGITGLGGASFPLHVKLSPPEGTKIDTVVINGAECEPYLTSDHRTMLERPKQILMGVLLMVKAVNADKAIIAIENNKPDAIAILKQLAYDYPPITIAELKTKYPQGSEKQLIQAITKKQVPSGALPSSVGLVVSNIDTCTAVAKAVVRNMPLIERNVTVSGDAVSKPANLLVRVGVKFSSLFESCDGFKVEPKKIVQGGPMMGISQSSLEVPVIKGTSGILAFAEPETYGKEESTCIRCSKCVDICPMRLMPNALSVLSVAGDTESISKYHIMDCMECGSCTYICPQRRFIIQHIKAGKALLRKERS